MPKLTGRFSVFNEPVFLYRPPLATHFNPKAWATAHLMDIVGPYAYALNLPQIAECKPGFLRVSPTREELVGESRTIPQTCEDLDIALSKDGLFYHGAPPHRGHAIGFFLKPATKTMPAEMLYLRRDSNNIWSYREVTEQGGCRRPHLPRQHDFNGKPIHNILKADFGRFTQCLGFASIPYEGIEYYRRTVIPEQDMRPFNHIVPAAVVLSRR